MMEWLVSLKEVNYQLYLMIEAGIALGVFIGIPFLATGCVILLDKITKKD